MSGRSAVGSIAFAMMLTIMTGANAQDQTKYPDWKGQWIRIGGGPYVSIDQGAADVRGDLRGSAQE